MLNIKSTHAYILNIKSTNDAYIYAEHKSMHICIHPYMLNIKSMHHEAYIHTEQYKSTYTYIQPYMLNIKSMRAYI
jgi:hypothetical protein